MALGGFETFETGTTEPMAVTCVDVQSGERDQYVVKFRNANRMSVKSSCRELLGAWMAMELGIHCIEPVLINITDAFVKTISGRRGYKSALQSIGYNFGSIYKAGYNPLPAANFHLNDTLRDEARLIFMFDMLIGNADRGAGKPNVSSNGQMLLVYDHELAFSFADLLSFARNPTPWIIGPLETEMYKQHYFYNLLRGENNEFNQLSNLLDCFNEEFWLNAHQWIPEEWKTEDLKTSQEHVTAMVSHKTEFTEQLTLILAS
jgi:hypothetical protein